MLQCAGAVEQFEQSPRKCFRAWLGSHRIAERHLLEREDHAVAGALFDAQRRGGDGREVPRLEKLLERATVECLVPAQMRFPLVVAFPVQVCRILEAAGEEAEEFPPRSLRRRGYGAF